MGLLFLLRFRESYNFQIQMLKLMSSLNNKDKELPSLSFPLDLEGLTASGLMTMISPKDKVFKQFI